MSRTLALAAMLAVLLLVAGVQDSSAAAKEPPVDREDDLVTLDTGPRQVVTGPTNFQSGMAGVVWTRSTAGATPFINSPETTVTSPGRFYAVLDSSGLEATPGFRATVRHNGSELTSVSWEAADCPGCTAENGTPTPTSLGVVEVTRGEVARLPFEIDEPLTVTVGEFSGSVTLAATVRDADGDGEIVLEILTATERIRVSGADEANVTLKQDELRLTDYEIRVYTGTDVGVGERDDGDRLLAEGTLVVLGSTETPTMTFEGDGGLAIGVVGTLVVGGLFGLLIVGLLIDFLRP